MANQDTLITAELLPDTNKIIDELIVGIKQAGNSCHDLDKVKIQIQALLDIISTKNERGYSAVSMFSILHLTESTVENVCEVCIKYMTLDHDEAIFEKCVDILKQIHLKCNSDKMLNAIQHTVKLLETLLITSDVALSGSFIKVLKLLCDFASRTDIDSYTETYQNLEDLFFRSLNSESEFIVGNMLTICLPVLFAKQEKRQVNTLCHKLWHKIKMIDINSDNNLFEGKSINTELGVRPYLILCGASSVLFPLSSTTAYINQLMNDNTFWLMIQRGCFHQNSLTRKQSLFIFKKVIELLLHLKTKMHTIENSMHIFRWDVDIMHNIWTDFILLLEILEEKQVHMIKPLMPKLGSLITAAQNMKDDSYILHTSWITTVLQRIASHHTVYIQRWGVATFLTIDFTKFPLYKQNGTEFLTGPFIAMLTQTSLYYKPTETKLGQYPPLVDSMAEFFNTLFQSLDQHQAKTLLRDFFIGIKKHFWSGAALVYLLRSFSHIKGSPIMDSATLVHIRDFMSGIVSTLKSQFRGAVQQYTTLTVMNLMDKNSVEPHLISSFLGQLSTKECFIRGSVLWVKVVNWLKNLVDSSMEGNWNGNTLQYFISSTLENFMKAQDVISEHACIGVIRLLLLTVDSEIIPLTSTSADQIALPSVLSCVIDSSRKLGSHLYMAQTKADNLVMILMVLLKTATCLKGIEDAVVQKMKSLLDEGIVTSLVQFFTRRITEISDMKDVKSVVLYADFLRGYSEISQTMLTSNLEILNLINICQIKLTDGNEATYRNQLARCSSMVIMSKIFNIFGPGIPNSVVKFFTVWKVYSDFRKPQEQQSVTMITESEKVDWGYVSSLFLESQWQCIHMLLQYNPPAKDIICADHVLTALDILGTDAVISVFKCSQIMLPQLDISTIAQLIDLGWRCTEESKKSSVYWSIYTSFLDMVLQTYTLQQPQGSLIYDKLQWLFKTVFTAGEEKLGLVNVLITKLCSWWQQSKDNLIHALDYIETIIKAVQFGELHSKGKRFENEVFQYLISCGADMVTNQLLDCYSKEDAMVRVCIITFLSTLDPGLPDHSELAHTLCEQLIKQQRDMLKVTSYRNFGNSLHHRQKHRLFCSLMVMYKFLEKDLLSMWHELLLDMLLQENQPSVRCFVEWMYIRLIHKSQQYMEQFWKCFEQTSEKKPVLMCSLLSTITHMAKLKHGKNQEMFIMEAIPKVFPWATAAQFNIRLFSQSCLIILWGICKDEGHAQVLSTHSLLQAFMDYSQTNSQAEKVLKQMLGLFFYQLNPFDDFSIESLVHTIPYLTGLTDEEWIHPSRFEMINSSWNTDGKHSLPLWNNSAKLKQCKPGTWRVKYSGKDEEWLEDTSDVQKKMVPWRNMLPEINLESEMQEEYSKKQQTMGKMVLCASLINKIPNLGGLCRTSEIFGVREYVVGSMKYVEDKNFESLSVTAHKWLQIKEVRPQYLKKYLLEMKENGYTIVGAEQTANSVPLTKYAFPVNTLMLLGNEKEGIPVELIQLLDACVEIPQRGVVRSLNVHVSGALMIWEYTRQHLLSTYDS